MKPIQIISQDLFDKIRSRFSNLEMGDETGAVTIDPAEARFFEFDFVSEGVDLGRISISLKDLGSLKVYYSQGITEGNDDPAKQLWYNFLKEMRFFAMRRLLRFDTRDIAKTNLDKNDFQHLASTQGPKEEDPMNTMNESQYNGRNSSKTSRAIKGRTEVIIRHKNSVAETHPSARGQSKNIKAIFVQNSDGERFKYPFIHAAGAFAMAQHVDHGGVPHDPAGKAIIGMSEEIAKLGKFQNTIRRHQAKLHDDALHITDRAVSRLMELKAKVAALGKRHHYKSWISEFNDQAAIDDDIMELDAVTMEDYRSKFTQKNFQEELSEFFPMLHKLMRENNKIDLETYIGEEEHEEHNNEVKKDMFSEFEQWAEDIETGEFNIEEFKTALEELPEPLTLTDDESVDEVIRFLREYGIEDIELIENLKDEARIDSTADPIKEVLLPWAQDSRNQEAYPGLSELLTQMVGGGEAPAETPPTPEPAETPPTPEPVATEPEQPVTESMIKDIANKVKSYWNRDNPTVGAFRDRGNIATEVKKEIEEKYGESAGEHARQMAETLMTELTDEWERRHSRTRIEMESILKLAGLQK